MIASTTFGTVTLKTNAGEEFKVNGQRLKHYQSREERKEELQLVQWERERIKTASLAKDSKLSSRWEATHRDF